MENNTWTYYCNGCNKEQECTININMEDVDWLTDQVLVNVEVRCPEGHLLRWADGWIHY